MLDALRWLVLGFILAASSLSPAATPEGLVWPPGQDRVSARLDRWTLPRVLEHVAAATGWQVYLEPETALTVSAQFENLKTSEALKRLLGDLNYALLPRTNGPPKLFVFRTSPLEATQLILPASQALAARQPTSLLPNELILVRKPGAAESIEDLARRLGARVVGRAEGLHAYRLQFDTEAQAAAARALLDGEPEVESVESNFAMVPPTDTQPLSLSSALPLNLKPKAGTDPNRPVIGLIDTAVQTQGSNLKDFLLPTLEIAGAATLPNDYPTHGTSMAETILRAIAADPKSTGETSVRILPVDVYGAQTGTSTFEVARGIYAAVKEGATVINLSLGGDGDSALLHRIIKEAHAQGVLFVAAAGNEPSVSPTYPAAYPEVLATTAGDRKGNIASYANRGEFVDLVAPGGSVITFNRRSYLVSGTSAATAYASGLAADLAADTGKNPTQIESQLRQTLAVKP